MGWDFTRGATRADIVREILTDHSPKFTPIAHALKGNVLWTVWQPTPDCEHGPDRIISCHLLRDGGRDGWGYKAMDEHMGPCEYSCPLDYIDRLAPETERTSEYSRNWRRKVREAQGVCPDTIPFAFTRAA